MGLASAVWNGCKVSFLIMGTSIGAGYASGREMWEFFSSYGEGSGWSVLLSMLLFSVSCYIIMKLSHELQAPHYVQVLEELLGKKLAKGYDVLIFMYLLSTTVVMFAGGGATVEYWDYSYWLGIGLMACAVFVVFLRNVEGVISLHSVITPFLIVLLVSVCFFFLASPYGQGGLTQSGLKSYPSGLAFTALNILPLIAILSAIGSKLKRIEMKIAGLCTFLCLSILSLLYNQSLLRVGDDVMLYEVPLFSLLSYLPGEMMVGVSIILWVAIYTTAVSNVMGIVSRFDGYLSFPVWGVAGFFILIALPLTTFGFGNLIQFLYPLFGVLNLFVLMMILIYPLANMKKIR